ncbi:MAG: hypothetical protein ABIJ27_00210 [Candidatus Omnitrophota bacterium]
MFRLRIGLVAMALIVGMAVSAPFAGAQAQSEEEDTIYSFGTVSMINNEKIVIKEIDNDTYEEVDVTYVIGPGVKVLEGTLDQVKAGDSVDIDYLEEGEARVVKIITVVKE